MQGEETELKFVVTDMDALRRRAASLGYHLLTERTFEQNTLYDTPERSLLAKRQVLRLRMYGTKCTLTHKRQPDNEDPKARYKTRIETETVIDDGAAMAEVFAQLGLAAAFHYDKYRTEWVAPNGAGHLVLDETPIGVWAELEGTPEWIHRALAEFDVADDASTTLSYGKLFLDWKERTGSPVEHMTFQVE